MKTSELAGATLDYWTAKAEGLDATLIHRNDWSYCQVDVQHHGYQTYQPTENWMLAAHLLVKHRYLLYPRLVNDAAVPANDWLAEATLSPDFHGLQTDPIPQIAICRLRVQEVYGDEVFE